MAKLNVYNMKKETVGTIDLSDEVFAVEYNEITYDIQENDIVFDVILSKGGGTND